VFPAFCLPHPSVTLSTMVSRLFACHTHPWPYPRWFPGILPATPIRDPIHDGFLAFCLPHPSVAISTMVSRHFACHTHPWPYPQWFPGFLPATPICGPIHNGFATPFSGYLWPYPQ
jgi:hypothetical protein